jgi:hypothetical protein
MFALIPPFGVADSTLPVLRPWLFHYFILLSRAHIDVDIAWVVNVWFFRKVFSRRVGRLLEQGVLLDLMSFATMLPTDQMVTFGAPSAMVLFDASS